MVYFYCSINAETIPSDMVFDNPKGLPIAYIFSPLVTSSESPADKNGKLFPSTCSIAKSPAYHTLIYPFTLYSVPSGTVTTAEYASSNTYENL